MTWTKFVEAQVNQAIDHPSSFPVSTAIFGVIAGMNIEQLLGREPVPFRQYLFALVWVLLTAWHAAITTRGIRLLRHRGKRETNLH